jgi:hypothetical protein
MQRAMPGPVLMMWLPWCEGNCLHYLVEVSLILHVAPSVRSRCCHQCTACQADTGQCTTADHLGLRIVTRLTTAPAASTVSETLGNQELGALNANATTVRCTQPQQQFLLQIAANNCTNKHGDLYKRCPHHPKAPDCPAILPNETLRLYHKSTIGQYNSGLLSIWIGCAWSYLAGTTGPLDPIWQPCTGSHFSYDRIPLVLLTSRIGHMVPIWQPYTEHPIPMVLDERLKDLQTQNWRRTTQKELITASIYLPT